VGGLLPAGSVERAASRGRRPDAIAVVITPDSSERCLPASCSPMESVSIELTHNGKGVPRAQPVHALGRAGPQPSLRCSPPCMVTSLVIAAALAFVAVRAGLRTAPLVTMLCVGVFGALVRAGALTLPTAITTPIAHANSELHAWQQRQSAALVCEVAWTRALSSEDERQLDRADRLCVSVTRRSRARTTQP
jgi:hypothetical protein